MDKIIVQFILLIICLFVVDSVIIKVYEVNFDVYNIMLINELLSFKQMDFLLMCSVLCVNGYNCFNFNIQMGICFFYNLCNLLDLIVFELGWCFFIDIFLEQEGKYMLVYYLFIIF